MELAIELAVYMEVWGRGQREGYFGFVVVWGGLEFNVIFVILELFSVLFRNAGVPSYTLACRRCGLFSLHSYLK